ncbi:MAG: 50S ribosomal protein L4 [Erysipelotrichaceae bacterium]|jgi:large subunit ribosomal protein L4|nr:50S ribosomal protein L4 [Erysipelotrichaceae bacterium]
MATKLSLYNQSGEKLKDVSVADAVFGITPNKQVLFDAVVMQQANMRQGTHDVKNRREVKGGGRKPWRQKGTGRARQGSTRATQWRGGGVPFGPTPRSYAYHLNRKVRRLALRSALSAKVEDKAALLLDSIAFKSIKTKDFAQMMKNLKLENKALFVVCGDEDWENAFLSLRNIENALILTVEGLNVYDVLNADHLVMTEAAAKLAGEVFA